MLYSVTLNCEVTLVPILNCQICLQFSQVAMKSITDVVSYLFNVNVIVFAIFTVTKILYQNVWIKPSYHFNLFILVLVQGAEIPKWPLNGVPLDNGWR